MIFFPTFLHPRRCYLLFIVPVLLSHVRASAVVFVVLLQQILANKQIMKGGREGGREGEH